MAVLMQDSRPACIPTVLHTIRFDVGKNLIRAGISLFFSRKDPFHTYNDFNYSGQIWTAKDPSTNCDNL